MCPTGQLIKDHIRSIMQLLTIDIAEYSMQLLTTKCLNTAVMMAYLMLDDASATTQACDVTSVKKDYYAQKSHPPSRDERFATLHDAVLNDDTSHRLFYIMLTDGIMVRKGLRSCSVDENTGDYVPKAGGATGNAGNAGNAGKGSTRTFPGHVFVIERDADTYYLYQSYIGHYTLQQHIDLVQNGRNSRNTSYAMDRGAMAVMLGGLKDVVRDNRPWDAASSAAWERFTHTPPAHSQQFEDYVPCETTMRPCYREVKIDGCFGKLIKLVDKHTMRLKDRALVSDAEFYTKPYGNPVYKYKETPLTPCELMHDLTVLKRKLIVALTQEGSNVPQVAVANCQAEKVRLGLTRHVNTKATNAAP
jgi:hypothetical protein